MSRLPRDANALFFDEIRWEAHGKFSCMGFYHGVIFLLDPENVPVDRIAVLVIAHWDFATTPDAADVWIHVPRQEPIVVPCPMAPLPTEMPEKLSPFAGMAMSLPLNLRCAPLQVGDEIEVWIHADGEKAPAGRLQVRAREAGPAAPIPTAS